MTDKTRKKMKDQETGKQRSGSTEAAVDKNVETGTNQKAEHGTRNPGPASGDTAGPESAAVESPEAAPHPFEALLDEYPLREPSEDPIWSVRIVKGWMYFLAFNFAWMFLFFILGIFYE